MIIKTIDLQAKEWFDKVNGNSYFSAKIILNYGMKKKVEFFESAKGFNVVRDAEKTINIRFQYGYGDQYESEAKAILTEHNYISANYMQCLSRYCRENDIIFRSSKQAGCKKRDCINFVN